MARGYVAHRRGNHDAWRYGFSFWDSLRNGAAAEAEREAAARVADQSGPDRLFEERDRLTLEPARRPESVRVAGYEVHLNALGLRGPDVALAKPAGVRRLLVLGGSFVFGWGLPDDQIWTTRLGDALSADRLVQVINGGRNGGTINWATMAWIRLSRRTAFDGVLLLSTYNNRTLVDVDGRPTWPAIAEYYLYNSSLLYVALEEKVGQLRRQTADYQHRQAPVRVSSASLDNWRALYRRRLEQVATVCRERGARLIVGAEPQRFYDRALDSLEPGDAVVASRLLQRVAEGRTISRSELEWLLQSVQIEEMRTLASHGDARFIDSANALPSDKSPWMIDEIHLNEGGSERFARFVAERIGPF